MAKARRTTHRSSAGKKLYAVRDKTGKFKDIQTYERAMRADLTKKSTAEKTTAAKKAAKKRVKKTAKKAAKKR
jgi:hypothetical protein